MTAHNDLLQEILDSMERWQDVRTDSKKLIAYFQGKRRFDFKYDPEDDCDMHAYPGIAIDPATGKEMLVFFVIPKKYDSAATPDLATKVQACKVGPILSNDEIPYKEAMARINYWKDRYTEWIPAQQGTENGMYKAFTIPRDDFHQQNYTTYLALKPDQEAPGGFSADLILDDHMGMIKAGGCIFLDTVRPVPPFKPRIEEADFHLLELLPKKV